MAVLTAWVIPKPVIFKRPEPTEILPKLKAELLVRETLLTPLLERATAPVKALLCVKVMALAPALKLEVPGTVKAPVWVMAPPAVTDKLPPEVSVSAGKVIAVVVKFKVRLRKLVKLARFVGSVALE